MIGAKQFRVAFGLLALFLVTTASKVRERRHVGLLSSLTATGSSSADSGQVGGIDTKLGSHVAARAGAEVKLPALDINGAGSFSIGDLSAQAHAAAAAAVEGGEALLGSGTAFGAQAGVGAVVDGGSMVSGAQDGVATIVGDGSMVFGDGLEQDVDLTQSSGFDKSHHRKDRDHLVDSEGIVGANADASALIDAQLGNVDAAAGVIAGINLNGNANVGVGELSAPHEKIASENKSKVKKKKKKGKNKVDGVHSNGSSMNDASSKGALKM